MRIIITLKEIDTFDGNHCDVTMALKKDNYRVAKREFKKLVKQWKHSNVVANYDFGIAIASELIHNIILKED